MKKIYIRLLQSLKEKNPLALASIIEAKGSTPQVPGASALFSSEGLLEGTLGGGLLEADVQEKALLALKKRDSFLSHFSLNAETFTEQDALCGGEVKILIDGRPDDHLDAFQRLSDSLTLRQSGVAVTEIIQLSGEKVVLHRNWVEGKGNCIPGLSEYPARFHEEIRRAYSEGKPRMLKAKDEVVSGGVRKSVLFIEPIFPLPHLVIAGAGHVGQAVAHLGSFLNFEVTVIDDRPEYANRERLPHADHIVVEDFSKALGNFPFSSDTYIVIVTRGHHHDATALRQCISSRAAYVGMIGSPRKIELMRKRFLENKWATPSQFSRVHAPIGIPIQSKTVEEIAVSIAAQLVLVRRQIQGGRKDAL